MLYAADCLLVASAIGNVLTRLQPPPPAPPAPSSPLRPSSSSSSSSSSPPLPPLAVVSDWYRCADYHPVSRTLAQFGRAILQSEVQRQFAQMFGVWDDHDLFGTKNGSGSGSGPTSSRVHQLLDALAHLGQAWAKVLPVSLREIATPRPAGLGRCPTGARRAPITGHWCGRVRVLGALAEVGPSRWAPGHPGAILFHHHGPW